MRCTRSNYIEPTVSDKQDLYAISSVLWKNLALCLIAFLVGLGVSELIIRSFIPVRDVGPSFTTYDPVYGQTLKKSFSAQRITPEFTMRFTTNSEGFRGPELGILSPRPILFLGDSFTMGYGVNDGEEFPALVRAALNGPSSKMVSVINAGVGNTGNGRWVKFLRAEAKRFNPRLVVLQIHGNDFGDNIRERLFELSPTGELIELPVPSPGAERMIQSLVEDIPGLAHSYLIGLSRQVSWPTNSPNRDPHSEDSPANSDRTSREEQLLFHLLEEVLTICHERGWQTLAVLVDIPDKRLAKMEKFLSVRDVLTVVIPPKRDRSDLYYKVDGHWNASGHRFTADRILEAMEKLHIQY
jgi:lysophospholipase L1-like esterase